MSQISGKLGFAAILTVVSMGLWATTTVVRADVPSATLVQGNSLNNLQLKKLMADVTRAFRIGNLPLATIELKNAIRLSPNNGEFHTLLGAVYLQSDQASAAEHELREARLDGANDQDALPLLLQSMVLSKEWRDILGQFPDPAPSDKSNLAASVLSTKAFAYESIGDDSDAVLSIERSLAIRRDVNGLLMRGRIAMLQSNSVDAMTFVNQALALAPNDANALLMKAESLSASDKNAALAMVNSLLKAHPNALNAIQARIELLIELGRNDEAQQSVDSALAQYPTLAFATFYKALLLGIHNKPLDGWRIAQSLPAEFIQSEARTAIGAAQLAARSGHLETANSILTTYVGQNPALVEPRLQLAALHFQMNIPNDALNDLEPLMDSKDPSVLEFIANAYLTLKRQEDAVTYLRKADAVGSRDPAVKFQLARVDLTQGNLSQGIQEMLDGMKMQPNNLDAPQAAINLLLTQSKFVEAQALADQAEKTNPKSPAPPLFRGEILIAQGRRDEGLMALNQSLQRGPQYLPALGARADAFIAQNKFADAIKDVKQIQVQRPNSPLPYVKLAEIAALSNQSPQSIALMRQAISKDPKVIGTRLVLAEYQVGLRQYADAETTLKTALQVFPNDPQALAFIGQVQQLMGQNAAALATNKLLVDKNQQSGAAQFLLANSLQQNVDKVGAVAAFKRAIELSPDVLQYRTSLINLQIQSGDNEGALVTARGWASIQKGPDATLLLAGTLARLKRFPEAASIIATSLKNQPDSRVTLLDSQIAMARGNRARSIAILKDWLADHASDIPVRQAYATALLTANDNAGALAQYEIVLKSRNDIPQVLNNTAWLVRDTDPSRALALASKAMELQPNSSDINDTVGQLLLKKGDAKGALLALQRAHAIDPADGEMSYHLALVLYALGRKVDAKQVIQAALGKDGTFVDAEAAKKLLKQL